MTQIVRGPPTVSRAILTSRGPSHYPFNYYSTSYSRRNPGYDLENPQPPLDPATAGEQVRQRGTGYVANFRPVLHYCPALDLKDNPPMICVLAGNYTSTSCQDYRGYRDATGKEPFPNTVSRDTARTVETSSAAAGFATNNPYTIPTSKRVKTPYDSREELSVPLLHSLRPGDPVMAENNKHGPAYMSTEFRTRYIQKPLAMNVERSEFSRKEESGFTHNQCRDPVTFRPQEAHSGDLSPVFTWRPTGTSIMKNDFHTPPLLTGREKIPQLSPRAEVSGGAGYFRGNKFPSNVQPLHTGRAKVYLGGRELTEVYVDGKELKEVYVGRKELTGFCKNHQPLVMKPWQQEPTHNTTLYLQRFQKPAVASPKNWIYRKTNPALPSGFTRGTQVHSFSKDPQDRANVLKVMDPSVARLVLHRDPFFDDHTHSHKSTCPQSRLKRVSIPCNS